MRAIFPIHLQVLPGPGSYIAQWVYGVRSSAVYINRPAYSLSCFQRGPKYQIQDEVTVKGLYSAFINAGCISTLQYDSVKCWVPDLSTAIVYLGPGHGSRHCWEQSLEMSTISHRILGTVVQLLLHMNCTLVSECTVNFTILNCYMSTLCMKVTTVMQFQWIVEMARKSSSKL